MPKGKLRLENKTALITGASRGLGRAIALRFAEEGASVAVNYMKNQKFAEEICSRVVASGGSAMSVQADVADRAQVDQMVETVLRQFRRVDILINNAGVSIPSTLLQASWQDLDRMIDVNLKGVIHCTRAVAGDMIQRRSGRIVNLASIAGLGTSFVGTSGYAATKAAVISLTKRLALELAAYNVTVNAIAPGFIKTDMALRSGVTTELRPDLEAVTRKTMLGRLGEPEDIAHAAVFLASDEASFITAQTLTVDGGRTDLLSHSA
jgi:3-oxoacyl-[acyl-carrier protein] reductase